MSGRQQRAAIACALVSAPIVFADESAGNLDSRATAEAFGPRPVPAAHW